MVSDTLPQQQAGFLLSRYSRDRSGRTEIVLWVVTDEQPARLVIEQEQPVFFVTADDFEKVVMCLQRAQVPFHSRELSLKTFQQQFVKGLYFQTNDAAFRGRDVLVAQQLTSYEADIRLHDRYLMERFVNGGVTFKGNPVQKDGFIEYRQVRIKPADYTPAFKVVSLDIECSEKGKLYSIGFHGVGLETVIMVGAHQEGCPWIQWVGDEKALLKALETVIAEYDPDIIIGWNVINFDCRLLVRRAEHHNIRLRIGRGWQTASWRDRRGEVDQGFITIPGRMVIDGIDALKAATYHFDSFSLEFVAQAMLNKGKATEDVDDRMAIINHDFQHDKQKLAHYNLEDCRLVSEIFDHTRLLDYLRLRSQVTGLELDRMGGSVQAFTNLYLPRMHRAGYVAPNLPDGGGLTSPGGYVMDSIPGLYKNVLVLDFKSLYPSIIRTFKIDPMGMIEGLSAPDQAIPGYRGGVFDRQKHFLPDIITTLWKQRDEAKQEKDGTRSQAIKILMNSFYGVLGSGGCRFYDPRLASSITMRGHDIMQQTARWIEQQGHKVIYGDTDSTFVLLDETLNHEQADAVGESLVKDINQRWQTKINEELQLPCFLELEYETHYGRFLMPTIRGSETGSKKRYAGLKVSSTGQQLIFKGLETVRSDWTPLAKQFQTTLFDMVFSDRSPSQLVKDAVRETLAGERDGELVYRKRLRRNLDQYVKSIPPQVRAARNADEQNKKNGKTLRYQNRGWISYVMTLNGPEAVEHLTSPIDYQHYIEKQLKPVADAVLPFIGLDFQELTEDQLGLF
ncbi:DNA polymerase II [Endozoicomonas sp. (ex Bugula neritina AB1)]|nr:DNA polymerase II [Endozoicomonas sp. (ex Bugula neritina AB1)]